MDADGAPVYPAPRRLSIKALAITALLFALVLPACGDEEEASEPSGSGEQAAIAVESPDDGATVSSPLTVSGSASVFEATVQIRVRTADGSEVGSAFATASEGAPGRGEFSEQVRFEVDEAQEGTVELFEENVASAGEGGYGGQGSTKLSLVQIPVTLEP